MTPYTDFTFFLLAAVALIPTMVLLAAGRPARWYNLFVSLLFLGLIFYGNAEAFLFIGGYLIWQYLLIRGYLALRKNGKSFPLFALSIVLSVAPLIWVKLVPLLQVKHGVGFLGISYLTFKAVQILIETHDGQIKEVKLRAYLSFLIFFPTLTSGPIDRYRRFLKDEEQPPDKAACKELFYAGINRIFRGFLYKFIIAYLINAYWLHLPLHQTKTALSALSYMYAYSMYLFFDFAGYSAFAVGLSYLMGIRTPENFNKPFLSRNIKEFWNRWHMSLSFWFRDYVYMRIVFFLTKRKTIADKFVISALGYLALFLLMGIWHGLQLHYIVYGLYHALLMIGFEFFAQRSGWFDRWKTRFPVHLLSVIVTFHFVCFGLLIFSGWLF